MSEFINTIEKLGDEAVMDGLIQKTITEFKDNVVTKVSDYAFHKCTALTEVDLPAVTSIGAYAFDGCASLESIYMLKLTTSGSYAFGGSLIPEITSKQFPSLTQIPWGVFSGTDPERVDFSYLSRLDGRNFVNQKLTTVVIRNTDAICTLGSADAFGWNNGTNQNNWGPIYKGQAHIYVPRVLLSQYISATNWSKYGAEAFRALEDYTVDGTITGELDKTKI